jgi:hypothetical protein
VVTREEWEKAQEKEREYVEKGENKQWNTPHSLYHWTNFLKLDTVDEPILEIGCGPNGLWRFKKNVTGLDPIDYSHLGTNFIVGIGEDLSMFEDDQFIYTIVCNSLDHSMEPKKVVSECFRVAPKLIFWSNVFPRHVAKIMKKIDSTHPYHFTYDDIDEIFAEYHTTRYYIDGLFSIHAEHVVSPKAMLKLMLADTLGVDGVCIHFER